MRRTWSSFWLVATFAAASLALSACSSTPQASPPASQPASERVPLPAGPEPAAVTKMVCAEKAQREMASVLGVSPTHVYKPTWSDHLYTCRFQYSEGTMVISVKELSSWGQTFAYFRALGAQMGETQQLENVGQGAYSTRNGSVVARKDYKILVVDTSGLPSEFGVPPTSSADVAVTVADLIMGCWAGD